MEHFLDCVSTPEQLTAYLTREEIPSAVAASRSVLVQVFTGSKDTDWIISLNQQIKILIPTATIAGTSSGGEIAGGEIISGSTLISLLCFHDTELKLEILQCEPGQENSCGAELGSRLNQCSDLMGILLLSPPANVDCARVLEGIEVEALSLIYNDRTLPEITISIGVVSTPRDGTELSGLMEAVDATLYRAKESGRNQVKHIE